jgi:hypothetical protein
LGLQAELIRAISDTAGANPFHALEQVRLLKETGEIGQNPKTGLLYMIGPPRTGVALPDSVFAAIGLRWHYIRERAPGLALLVWGSALLDDHLPLSLFRHLWAELAPEVSVREIDATDMLWTGDGDDREVVFRHENYFESVRRFTVSDEDRRRVVNASSNSVPPSWSAGHAPSSPTLTRTSTGLTRCSSAHWRGLPARQTPASPAASGPFTWIFSGTSTNATPSRPHGS